MSPEEYDRLAAIAEWDEEMEWQRFNLEGPMVEPPEDIGTVIWPDGIISDDSHEQAAISWWNAGY